MPLLIVMQMRKFSVVQKMLKSQLRPLCLPKPKKKKKKPSKPIKIAAKRQKAQATCKGSMCVMQRAVRKALSTWQENLARLYQMNKYYVQPATDGEIAKL